MMWILKNKKGSVSVWIISVCLCVLIIFVGFFEYFKITNLTSKIKQELIEQSQVCMTEISEKSYDELAEQSQVNLSNPDDIKELLVQNLVNNTSFMIDSENRLVKELNGVENEVILSDITIEDNPLALHGTGLIKMPIMFNGDEISTVSINIQYEVLFNQKY